MSESAISVTGWLREHWKRVVAGAALATVATVAGVISYTHIDALTLALGGSRMAGHLMPFGVDGQIVVGSVVLLTATGTSARWGWLGIIPGLAESLFANFEAGIAHGLLAAAWYTVPAESFAVASFIAERWLKSLAATPGHGGMAGQPNSGVNTYGNEDTEADLCSHCIGATVEESAVQAYLHARDCLGEPLSQRKLSDQFGLSRPRVAELVAPHAVAAPPVPSVNGSAH